jgi:hypothetical protein
VILPEPRGMSKFSIHKLIKHGAFASTAHPILASVYHAFQPSQATQTPTMHMQMIPLHSSMSITDDEKAKMVEGNPSTHTKTKKDRRKTKLILLRNESRVRNNEN